VLSPGVTQLKTS